MDNLVNVLTAESKADQVPWPEYLLYLGSTCTYLSQVISQVI